MRMQAGLTSYRDVNHLIFIINKLCSIKYYYVFAREDTTKVNIYCQNLDYFYAQAELNYIAAI